MLSINLAVDAVETVVAVAAAAAAAAAAGVAAAGPGGGSSSSGLGSMSSMAAGGVPSGIPQPGTGKYKKQSMHREN